MIFNVVGGGGSGLKMELLWENASFTSAFPAHEGNNAIPLDLSGYQFVDISLNLSISRYKEYTFRIFVGHSTTVDIPFHQFDPGQAIKFASRTVTVNTNGVEISACTYTNDINVISDDTKCIPVKIYGGKGVSA